jgi:hypothetical protein
MSSPRTNWLLLAIRYGIGGALVLAGILALFLAPSSFAVDGFALGVGAGASVLMLNFLFRLGVSGDLEREQEEEARRYLEEHGVWPDEAPVNAGRPTAGRERAPLTGSRRRDDQATR